MSESPKTTPPRPRRVLLILAVAGAGAVALAASGIADRARSMQEVSAWTDAQAVPSVHLVAPQRGPDQDQLALPGTVSAFGMSSLYPRASGYIAAWHKDIGAHVTKGEVLATISAPDLDQQLAEAKAQLVQLGAAVQQAQATADLGQATDLRTSRLVAQGWTSKEQGDTDRLTAASRTAALAVAKANVEVQQAVVGRLEELTRFEQVVAPFDGVVTARNVDLGDLVAAGGTSGKPLFQVADIHRMRVYVNVPQAYLGTLKPGMAATLHLPGSKDTTDATLVTTSNAVAESSRTASIELDADNAAGKLWPGAFAEVQFHIPADPNRLSIPMTAVVFGAHGMQVAAVDGAGKVTLKPVDLGRNLGDHVEVESGLTLGDKLIDNPLESTQTGDVVAVADTAPRT
jgi:RND family efflux transporter MFP subunit